MNGNEAISALGFIGLGRMGHPMAANLVRAGFDVTAYARSQSTLAAAEAVGVRIAANPFELARNSEVVLTCLPRSSDVLDVLRGRQGLLKGLRRGTVVVDMGTHSPTSAVQ